MDEQGTIKTEEQGAIRTQPHKSFGPMEFLWRWAASLLLVLGTWNPSGHSYVNWVVDAFGSEAGFGALHLFVGAILLAGWAVFWIATNNALGAFGTVLAALVIGSAIWLLADFGLVNADSTSAVVWLALIALATLLAVGLSWSHIWRRLSGQVEVTDDED